MDAVEDPIGVKNFMGIVPQEAQLFDMLTVRETLRIFGKLRGLSGRDVNRRADEVISDLRLGEHRNVVAGDIDGADKSGVFPNGAGSRRDEGVRVGVASALRRGRHDEVSFGSYRHSPGNCGSGYVRVGVYGYRTVEAEMA